MPSPTLVDPRGRPILIPTLRKKEKDPFLLGRKQNRFGSVVAQGLTPESLRSIFDETRRGKLVNFLMLAKDLEKHDSHYRSTLALRKLAVLRRKPEVIPASDDTRDILIAEEFQKEVVDKPEWVWFTLHCLDNLGKGFSVTEMVWDFSEGQAMPTFHSREAVDFTLDPESLTRIGKRTLDAKQFEDFEPGKYVCHSGSLISGNPVEGALAFTSSILYLYKNLALQNFGTFIERFGTPFIFAQYLRSEDKDDLIEGLEEIAHAGYGVAPKGTILETIDGARIGGSENLHENAVEMFNRLQSKLVLGQTMTMDDGSSRSQAEVHERVSESINDWDILTVCSTQVQQVFDIWRVLNFGPGGKSGSMDRPQNDEQDLDTLVKVATEMADRGARVPYKRILNIAGFQEPEEDDELLQPRSTGDGDIPGMPRRFERAMQLTPAGAPGGGSNARS